jgi:hypothetical protein
MNNTFKQSLNKCYLCPKNQTELYIVANSLINEGYLKVCNDCLNEYKVSMSTRLLSGELE